MATERVLVDASSSLAWTEVAQGARLSWHTFVNVPPPVSGSNFDRAMELFPDEPVADRARSYTAAALEHLILWADVAAPLRFHPEHEVHFQQRPPYTLARAAMEAAAQAIWMLDTRDPAECIRRHLCLIRWDLQEHRKSKLDPDEKLHVKSLEDALLRRVAPTFSEQQIQPPPGYLWVIRQACAPDDLALHADEIERLWRGASGSAHGMYWPTKDLQKVVEIQGHDGSTRHVRIADSEKITAVLRAAYTLTQYAVLKYAQFAGADIGALIDESRAWLADKITIRADADPEVLGRFREQRTLPNQ